MPNKSTPTSSDTQHLNAQILIPVAGGDGPHAPLQAQSAFLMGRLATVSPAKHPSRTVTSQHQLEQRRRSQVRADAGSLADPRGACGACHGGGAAAAESPRPPGPSHRRGQCWRPGRCVSRLLDADVGRSHGDLGRATIATRDARTEQAAAEPSAGVRVTVGTALTQ